MKKKIAFVFDIPKNERRDIRTLQQWVHPSIDYDILYLTDDPGLKRVLVKDITLDIKALPETYLFVVPVGAESYKKIVKHKGGISKYHAQLLTDPMPCVPIKSPNIIFLNPTEEPAIKKGFDVILKAWKEGSTEVEKVDLKYKMITTASEFKSLLVYLGTFKSMAYDLETTDLDPIVGEIIGCSLCAKRNEAYFVPYNLMEECKIELAALLIKSGRTTN